ncbi:MAG: enoyl-CoA hydratase/isomerase family protein [Myxococcales bacterium]|jgi:enoyl-CoA hydratase|nr:enoyl-CoA hydratase/isomerase family protein [Myxococcales bacterium]
MTDDILLVEREGGVAHVTLNRPDKLNALNTALLDALLAAIVDLDCDPDVRACVMTGAGDKAFAAGADIQAMVEMTTSQAKAFSDKGHALGAAMESAHFPIIGAINGFALGGGCELALACDFLYASEKAKFGQPEVNLAVIPGFGGTQRLARRVGIGRARELCFTGDLIGAEEALRIGLVNVVTPHADLLAKAKDTAARIAKKGPLAVAQCKRAMLRGADVPLAVAHELEAQAFSQLFGTADQREGMRAFLDKRPASFTGK